MPPSTPDVSGFGWGCGTPKRVRLGVARTPALTGCRLFDGFAGETPARRKGKMPSPLFNNGLATRFRLVPAGSRPYTVEAFAAFPAVPGFSGPFRPVPFGQARIAVNVIFANDLRI